MAIFDNQKVDYLWKKLGYGRSKTDVNSVKNATNESIASPLFLRGDNIWAQSDQIPSVIPTSTTEFVEIYSTSTPVECTVDITASPNRTWKTNLIDWIPPEIGATYNVKVYIHTAGQASNAAASGDQLFAAGSGNDDEWFFDYQSGTLNFIGANLPNGINFSGKSVYISGARYTGIKGVPAAGAATTFTSVGIGSHLTVTGFSTFTGAVDLNGGAYIDNVQIGITDDNEIDTATGNLVIDSAEGQVTIDDRLIVVGVSTFNSDVDIDANLNVDSTLIVTGLSTFTNTADFNGGAYIDNVQIGITDDNEIDTTTGNLVIDSAEGQVTIDDRLIVTGISTFNSDVDIDANLNIDSTLIVTGVSTFASNVYVNSIVDISNDLTVDGTSNLNHLNVTGLSTFSDNVRIKSDDFLKFGDSDHFSIFAGVGGQTFLTQHASQPLSILGNTSLVFKVNGSENAIIATANDSVELYWDNSKRLETTGSGIDITGHTETDTFNVSGLSTFASNVDINADLDVDGFTELDSTNISETLNVSGLSTFASNVDINADLDVDGFTELDSTNISETLNVVGLTTLGSNVDINADLDVDGFTELDSTNISETLNVAGLSTFASNVDINADLDVDGRTELDTTNISETLNVVGLTTLGSNVDINADLDVDGRTELDTTNISETLNVVGLTTLGSNVDINADVDISGNLTVHTDLDVDGHTELDDVNVSGVITATSFHTGVEGSSIRINSASITGPSTITIDPSGIGDNTGLLIIKGDLQVDGTQTIINSTSVTVDDLNIMLADGAANDAAADGGGITVQSGEGNKTFQFESTGDNFGSSENINLSTGKTYKIANTEVLSSTQLTVANINSSGIGTIETLDTTTGTIDYLSVSDINLSGLSTFSSAVDINADLDVDGFTELDSTNISETLNVVGLTTLGSNVDINADLDVDGFTELDSTNISETLNVVGLTTLGSNVDINADLDVDGFTELDSTNISETLNVVGVSTFASNVDINADLDVDGHTELDSTNISETLNVVGLTTLGSNVDINADLDVDGFTELDSTNISETLNVVGLTTLGSNVDINADLDVDGFTELDSTNISETLNVVGLTTLGSNVDINASVDISNDLIVDGTTDLDELNVAGLSTFASNVDINADLDVDGTTELDELNVAGLSTFASNIDVNASVDISNDLTVDGTTDLDELNVTGISTFSSNVDINADLDVDGTTELDELNVSGLSTFASNVDINADLDVDGFAELDATNISETLNVAGLSTFASNVDINADLDVDGLSELDELNVAGIATFASDLDINASIDVDGLSELDELNVAGLSTFASDLDINASIDVSTNLTVDGLTDIDELNVAGIATFASDLDINASIDVDGHTELDELNVSGIATFNNDLIVDGTTDLDELNVAGLSTFASDLDINASIDVDGLSNLDELRVTGLSTFTNIVEVKNTTLQVTNSQSSSNNLDIKQNTDGTSEINKVGAGALYIGGNNIFIKDDGSNEVYAGFRKDGSVSLNYDSVTKFETTGYGVTITGGTNVTGIVTASKFDGDLNALGNTYYVATTGSDSNSGDNINEPYLTIAKALTVATSGDIVYVGAGVFDETCPLTVPSGVTVRGSGLRSTTIRPTTATKTNNVFLLSDVSTLEDFTIKGSYYDSTNDTGYAFSYASGITIATRSPYIQRVTVLNRGSVVTSDDPYGFDTADSPPTSYIAGRGAKVDGSLVTSSSIEAGMLFNEVTFFTPNNKGVILTNGARAEYLNCFHYFASQAIVGLAGTTGIGGNADVRLKFSNPNVTPSVNDVVKLFESGVGIATGTITSYSNDYATIDGLGEGTFTSVGAGSTQDVRFFQSDGTTQSGIASAIILADYTMFGAEMRSVGCAVEYGTQGVVADGNGVKLRMFATNFNHVGSGKDFSNDTTLTIQANEVVELNSGQVSYVSIDQGGDFRVGDALFIDQETGNVSFAATSYSLDVTGTIDVTDGTNTSTLTPTSITVGGLQLASNQLSSLSGDITIDPSGSNKTVIQGNLDVNGTLNASVVNIDAVQKGDTSISITDTGTDGSIIFYTDNSEAFRINNTQTTVFTGNIDANGDLDVDGQTNLDNVDVSGITTTGGLLDINAGGQANTFKVEDLTDNRVVIAGTGGELEDDANLTFNGSTLSVGVDLDVDGHTELDDVNISGIVTATAFHTGAEGSAIRVSSDTISGPATLNIDPAGVGDNTGTVVIKGDLQVDGTQTIINSTTVTVNDLNIQVADGAANDAAADGAGITVNSGDGNKTFQFEATGDNFGSSEHINLATGKTYKINNTEVLSSTRLTVSEIVASGIGTIATLDTTTGTIDYLTNTNLNTSGIGTIATLDSTTGTIDYLSGTNVSYSGIGTIATLDTTTGTIDYLTNINLNTSGIGTIATLDSTNVNFTNVSVTGIVTSNVGFAGTVLTKDGTGYVLIPGDTVNDTSQLYNTNLYNDQGQVVTNMVAGAVHFAGVADGLTGTPDIEVGIVTATGQVKSNVGFAGTVLSQDGTGNVLIPGASASDTSQLYNTNLYDSLGRVVTNMVADQIHWAGVADGLTGTPDIQVGLVTATNLEVTGITTSPTYDTDNGRSGSIIHASSGTSQLAAHSLSSTSYRSVEYLIQATEGVNVHLTKLLVIHDGTAAYMTEYGSVFNTSAIATYDVAINAGQIELLVTPSSALPTEFKITYTAIVV